MPVIPNPGVVSSSYRPPGDEAKRVAKWWGRIDASQKACDDQSVFWDKLEDALAGTFP